MHRTRFALTVFKSCNNNNFLIICYNIFVKVSKFLLKFCVVNKFYGRALKILFKQNEEKPTIMNDRLIVDCFKQLKLDYAQNYYENEMILKYPKAYSKF